MICCDESVGGWEFVVVFFLSNLVGFVIWNC